MYVLHFYTATHDEGLRSELTTAVDAGLPVFISECGLTEATGDGRIDFASAVERFSCLDERKISYTVWSLSDKDESSAFFKPGFDPEKTIEESDLTPTGLWVRELIRGTAPSAIPSPQSVLEKSRLSAMLSWISTSLGERGYKAVLLWRYFALFSAALFIAIAIVIRLVGSVPGNRTRTYDDLAGRADTEQSSAPSLGKILTGQRSISTSATTTEDHRCGSWQRRWASAILTVPTTGARRPETSTTPSALRPRPILSPLMRI